MDPERFSVILVFKNQNYSKCFFSPFWIIKNWHFGNFWVSQIHQNLNFSLFKIAEKSNSNNFEKSTVWALHHSVEITEIYSHFWQKIRESNVFTKDVISRKKNPWEWISFFSTLCSCSYIFVVKVVKKKVFVLKVSK